jgi:hypothetical protein
MLDVTIVNVGLPSIRRELHASSGELEWVISGKPDAAAGNPAPPADPAILAQPHRTFLTPPGEGHNHVSH